MNPKLPDPRTFLFAMLTGLVVSATATAGHNTPEALEARTVPEGRLNVVESGSLTVLAEATAGAPQSGEEVYKTTCAVCHDSGVAGAPKTGDVAVWQARIAQGMSVLVEHAINGFQGQTGVMLPKGGNAALSDAEVEAAVVYMVENSQ